MLLGTGTTKRCTTCIFWASEFSRRSSPFANQQPARWTSSQTTPLAGGGPLRMRNLVSSEFLDRKTLCLTQKRFKGGSRSSRPKRKGSKDESTYSVFGRLLEEQLLVLQEKLIRTGFKKLRTYDLNSRYEVQEAILRFRGHLRDAIKQAEKGRINKTNNPIFYRLRASFVEGNLRYLHDELRHSFVTFLMNPKLKMSWRQLQAQERLADLQHPTEWYPATRAIQRTIHLHIGPTNSGKTYHALKRLEEAETGIYAGPLRLLAHEVYTRFNAKGKLCALVTGEEKRIPPDLKHVMQSCTVEMVSLNAKVDVAVIDEIQMIADEERGWAWTQAFLGVQAKEVHLCGEVRTEELIKKICALTGEKLVIHRYERLNPLEMESKSIGGKLTELKKGDAVILFTRVGIHAMKSSIEKVTGRRCAVVYGSLPPETRAQQAALFNDPDNDYDFLVASDAVGMGLNLSIRRIIFEATSKNDGFGFRLIRPSEIKQIAGRAGRYKSAHEAVTTNSTGNISEKGQSPDAATEPPKQNVGYVTTFDKFDLPIVNKAMEQEVKPLRTATILPPDSAVHRFASYFPPGIPFSYIYLSLYKMAVTSPIFKIGRLKEEVAVADLIQDINLTNADRMIFMKAPVSLRDIGFPVILTELAACVADHSGGELLDLQSLNLELLEREIHDHPDGTRGYLREAETLHKALTLYLWLSYRYNGVFTSQALAFHTKTLVEKKIDECLAEVQWDEQGRERLLNKRMTDLLKEAKRRQVSRGVVEDAEVDVNAEELDLDTEEEENVEEENVPPLEDGLYIPSSGPKELRSSVDG